MRGKTYILDDGRESPAIMLLKNGIADVNTEDPAHIELAKNELLSLIPAVNIKYSNEGGAGFTKVAGIAWVHHTWSGGDMLAAPGYVAGGIQARGSRLLVSAGGRGGDHQQRPDRHSPGRARSTQCSRSASSTTCST